jgi:hypothetical protein
MKCVTLVETSRVQPLVFRTRKPEPNLFSFNSLPKGAQGGSNLQMGLNGK